MDTYEVTTRQLQNSRTWEAKIIDPEDGYVVWVEWAEGEEKVMRKVRKFARKHRLTPASDD